MDTYQNELKYICLEELPKALTLWPSCMHHNQDRKDSKTVRQFLEIRKEEQFPQNEVINEFGMIDTIDFSMEDRVEVETCVLPRLR